MAEDKKSFVLYSDFEEVFENLTDAEAGQLIKHIFSYVNDRNPAELEDKAIKASFIPIKLHLKRDLVKYEKFRVKQAENGKLGGRPKKEIETELTQITQAFILKPKIKEETQKSLSVNVNVSDSVNVNDNVKETIEIATPQAATHTPDEKECFLKFKLWLKVNAPRVDQLKEPLSIDQFLKLKDKIPINDLTGLLVNMQNYKPLLTKSISAYLTVLKWNKNEDFNHQPKIENNGSARKISEEKARAILSA